MADQICPTCGKYCQAGDGVCVNCGFVFSTSAVLSPGTILRRRYEIQQLIHTGGMGFVYLAKDKNLFDRSCVVKQVRELIQSEEHRKKLEEEALRMAKLSHPSIAMIFDHFVERGYYFLVVERIYGKTLSEVFKDHQSQLGESDVVNWAASICDAITFIHKLGVIHRDISPDNIMLTEDGSIKFIDFGTLRELRYFASGQTAGMGKYGYTPPEQWQGKPEPRSDIFALGATLYYLMTGFLPLSRSYITSQTPQREDFYPQFPPIRDRNPDISSQFEGILEKALQLDINERYSSALEMRQALVSLRDNLVKRDLDSPEKTTRIEERVENSPTPSRILNERHKNTLLKENRKITAKSRKLVKPKREVILSDSVIRRKAIGDTVQHPTILLPATVCVLSTIYLVILSPIFGGDLEAVVLIPVSGIAAGVLYYFRYTKEYPKKTHELMVRQQEEREELEDEELEELYESLEEGFSGTDSGEGLKILAAMFREHEQLRAALDQRRATDPLSLSLIPALTAEIYRRGLSVLADALELMEAIKTPGRENLEKEIFALEREVEALKDDPAQAERLRLRQENLASYRERLDLLHKLQLDVDRLLYQAQRCEASLHSTRIDLATIRAGSTKNSVDSVIETLQENLKQVKEVQDELKKLGY